MAGIHEHWLEIISHLKMFKLLQAFNGGNWVRVENAARNKAANLKQDVLIFTGTYGILSLPNENNTQIPLTLEANGIEVPKWYWKIIKASHLNAAIVLIGLNNPFATSLVECNLEIVIVLKQQSII